MFEINIEDRFLLNPPASYTESLNKTYGKQFEIAGLGMWYQNLHWLIKRNINELVTQLCKETNHNYSKLYRIIFMNPELSYLLISASSYKRTSTLGGKIFDDVGVVFDPKIGLNVMRIKVYTEFSQSKNAMIYLDETGDCNYEH